MRQMKWLIAFAAIMAVAGPVAAATVSFELGGYNMSFQTNESLVIGKSSEAGFSADGGGHAFSQPAGGNITLAENTVIGPRAEFDLFRYKQSDRVEDYHQTVKNGLMNVGGYTAVNTSISTTTISGVQAVAGAGTINVSGQQVERRIMVFQMPGSFTDICIILVNGDPALFTDIEKSLRVE